MNIIIDMNLSPAWVKVFNQHGWTAQHWSSVGNPNAPDREIMAWARENKHVVCTHDLDFGIVLALTHSNAPSVIQVRTQDVMPENLAHILVPVLHQHQALLEQGALVTVDETKSRVRILPL